MITARLPSTDRSIQLELSYNITTNIYTKINPMSNAEDPFDQVARDTEEQIQRLKSYLTTHSPDNEVTEIIRDVEETIVDLDKTIDVMRRSGQQDVSKRELQLQQIRNGLEDLKRSNALGNTGIQADNGSKTNVATTKSSAAVPLEENSAAAGESNLPENPFQEQILKEQDQHLDDIHLSMQRLHMHAKTIGQELEDQGQILEEMDEGLDTITGKLDRGRRQLEWIYEKNKEKYNNCCIGLLIIALIVLLVLAFIA